MVVPVEVRAAEKVAALPTVVFLTVGTELKPMAWSAVAQLPSGAASSTAIIIW